jgi:large subunit ribosomal protein L30
MSDKKTITVQLAKSVAGTRESHRATIRGLGLRKLGNTRTLEDTPSVRGMITKVAYLVRVI